MAEPIKLKGQRWVYKDDLNEIVYQMAYNMWSGFLQEQITLNGEAVWDKIHDPADLSDVTFKWRKEYEGALLTEQAFEVHGKSGMFVVYARLYIAGEICDWTNSSKGKWTGEKGVWPV